MTRIGVDADGVLYDYVTTCANYINLISGKDVASYDSCNNYDALVAWGIKRLQKAVDQHFSVPGNVLNMPMIEGAKALLVTLQHEVGKDNVVIVTACPPSWHNDRATAIGRDFGIPLERIVFSYDKRHANVDILIDDHDGNFGGDFEGILIDRPWNQDGWKTDFRAFTYTHVIDYIKINKNRLRKHRELDSLRAHVEHIRAERDEYRSRLSSITASV